MSLEPEMRVAKLVFQSAIDGLNQLASSLDGNFSRLVDMIYSLDGKVILAGMGKSGHIAKKISSTLASTGTPSYFIHPGEASHGDLGMIAKNDLIILLSNSGETAELKDIVNYAKRFHISLVSIVKNIHSSLALASDFIIAIPDINEALDFSAPTTSTTMMLVLGDAIALSLLEKRDFTIEDFKIFHPGGRLGASLVKVKDIMNQGSSVPIIFEEDNMKKIIEVINDKKFGVAIVVDNFFSLRGIITDGCLRRNLSADVMSLTASMIMKKNPITIRPNSLTIEALDLMNKKAITSLIVTEDTSEKVIGIIHIHDCLKSGASPFL